VEWERTVEAAKREGKVVITAFSQGERDTGEKFNKLFPEIKPDVYVLPGRDFSVRVPEERRGGIYSYDVYLSGGTSALTQLIPLGGILGDTRSLLFHPDVIADKNWVGGSMDDHWMDDDTKKIIFGMVATAGEASMYVNRQKVPESLFNKLEDIFKPQFKAKWCADDPRVPGAGATFFAELAVARGEDFVRRLIKDTSLVVSRDRRKMAEDVIRGDMLVCIGADLATFQDVGVGLHVVEVKVERGTVSPEFAGKIKINCCGAGKQKNTIDGFFGAGVGGPAVVTNAPHPNAAKLFINWVLTKEGQMAYHGPSLYATVIDPYWDSCTPRVDLAQNCEPGDALQDGKAYITFHRTSNVRYREAGQNLAREILGR
jgi:iron(III) transport system substrate-binding protein